MMRVAQKAGSRAEWNRGLWRHDRKIRQQKFRFVRQITMTNLSKISLTVAIAGLAGGSIVASYGENASPVALAAMLPLGAVAFGLFLIVFTLEKEVADYDREQAAKGLAPRCDTVPAPNNEEIRPHPAVIHGTQQTV